ncbi:MAG: hypothetical protein ACLPWO_05495 [Thermoplasmata archaeon]
MGTPTFQIQSGYRQAWVNWTYTIPSPGFGWTPGFSWSLGSASLSIPSITASTTLASINLNDLTAGTTYSYTAAISSCGGSATKSGPFTTSNAPNSEFVGWVSQMVPNSSKLDQVGSPISGATFGPVWATCINPGSYMVRVPFPAATTTSSAGYYALTFPLKDTELGYTYYDLWPNGWCKDNTWPGSAGNVSNSMLTLNVSAPGYWSATEFVSFVNSATNDYQQFGLPSNGVSVSPLSVAFVHTSLLSCGVNITNGVSQGVESSLGGSGYTATYTNSTLWRAPPVSNGESTVTTHYDTTGIVNETTTPWKIVSSQAYGNAFDTGADAYESFVDPNGSPPANAVLLTLGAAGAGPTFFTGGTYTSSAGLDLSVGLSLSWGGVGMDLSTRLVDVTTAGVSSQRQISCALLSNPPKGDDYQFDYLLDGSGAGSSQAVNVHLWYVGECVINPQGTCS